MQCRMLARSWAACVAVVSLSCVLEFSHATQKVVTLNAKDPGPDALGRAERDQKQLIGMLSDPPKHQGTFERDKWLAQLRFLRQNVAARAQLVQEQLLVNHGNLTNPQYREHSKAERAEMDRLGRIKSLLRARDDRAVERLIYSGRVPRPSERSQLFVLLVRKFKQHRLDFREEWPLLAKLAATAHIDLKTLEAKRHAQDRSVKVSENPKTTPQMLSAIQKVKEAEALEELAKHEFKHEEVKRRLEVKAVEDLQVTGSMKLREKMADEVSETKAQTAQKKIVRLKARVATIRAEKALKRLKKEETDRREARIRRARSEGANTLMQQAATQRAIATFEQVRQRRLAELGQKHGLSKAEKRERFALSSYKLRGTVPLFSPPSGSADKLALCSSMKKACSTPNVRCMCQRTCGTANACRNDRAPAEMLAVSLKHSRSACNYDALGSCHQMRASCHLSPSVRAQCCKTCAQEKAKALEKVAFDARVQRKFVRDAEAERARQMQKKVSKLTHRMVNTISQLPNRHGASTDKAVARIKQVLESMKKDSNSSIQDDMMSGNTSALLAAVSNNSTDSKSSLSPLVSELKKLQHLGAEASKPKGTKKASEKDIKAERAKIQRQKASLKAQDAKDKEDKAIAGGGVKYRHGTVPWEDAVRQLPAASESSRGNASPLPDQKTARA